MSSGGNGFCKGSGATVTDAAYSPALQAYLDGLAALDGKRAAYCREHGVEAVPQSYEAEIIGEMDRLWRALTDEEQQTVWDAGVRIHD